jgi:ATP-dependent RNA helicase DDX60
MSDRLPPLSPFTSDFRLDPWQKRVLKLIDARKSVVISAPTSSGKTVISTYVATLGRLINKPTAAAVATNRPAPPANPNGEEAEEEVEGDEDEINTNVSNKDRVLFVVPTEPLVWQVAAHFARHILNGNVALVTDQLIYSPHPTLKEPPAVVVGTPRALETAMTKIRGKASFLEKQHLVDRAQMVGGFDHYGWVVYDEIHVLDGEDGEALQRLIRLMKCNFLALSATVGNAEELRSWMEKVRGEHLNVEVVNAPRPAPGPESTMGDGTISTRETVEQSIDRAEREDANRLVKLQTHDVRFLNIQRHIWTKSATSNAFELKLLHPLSAITLKFLQGAGFKTAGLPMTPRDSYVLYEAMKAHYPTDAIADLDPHRVFSTDESARITLSQAKDYEDLLKERLEGLAKTHVPETQSLLDAYHLEDLTPEFDICEMSLNLKRQNMLPCLVFHLNVFELIHLFRELLSGVERRQKETHPNYYLTLQQKAASKKAQQESLQRDMKSSKDLEEAQREGVIEDSIEVVDFTAPHPDFVFCPGAPISSREFEDICKEVKQRDHFEGDFSKHALMRALRRGIGIYINDHHFTAYRVAIMRLAMQGKLGLVLSDASLAYGVNMPFRSCVFCGEMGGKLDTILAQQMAGRSGRRGLDTQGHLIYAGARAKFVRRLMLAEIPAITGREPRYHTQFLQEMLSLHSNPKELYPNQMHHLGGATLQDFILQSSGDPTYEVVPNFRDVSIQLLLELNLIEECDQLPPDQEDAAREAESVDFNSSATISHYRPFQGRAGLNGTSLPAVNCPQLWMVWELRQSLSESIYLGCMLPHLFDEFIQVNAKSDVGEDVSTQLTFLLFLLLTIDRTPYKGTGGFCTHDLMNHPFITSRGLSEKLLPYEEKLRNIEAIVERLPLPKKDLLQNWKTIKVPDPNQKLKPGEEVKMIEIRVPFPIGEPLDATVFDCLTNPGHIISLPSEVKQFLKEKFLSIQVKLAVMHNTLFGDTAKYGKFAMLTRSAHLRSSSLSLTHSLPASLRKCFNLIQYVSRDLIQNIVNFADVSSADTERI